MGKRKESLLVFEEELELIEKELEENVIRTANSRQNPQNPLRHGKEITYDKFGNVLPNSKTGISLAASIKQLKKIVKPGIKKWLLAVDRNSVMPQGFKLQPDNNHHWSIVVTEPMTKDEYDRKVKKIIKDWRVMGRFVRYE